MLIHLFSSLVLASGLLDLPEPILQDPPTYPWERRFAGVHPRITREHFRCRGSGLNPMIELPDERIPDCRGDREHGLPIVDGEEFVYPALIELLNYVQEQSGKRVIVTSGHRCPTHNRYVDRSHYNSTSKHQVAAEVAFYVEDMAAEAIVELLIAYYPDDEFRRYEKPDTNVRTPPWFNKEIFIKLFQADEGRDFDNQHNQAYVAVQLRWDRDRDERVVYEWHAARRYLRR